MTTFLSILQQVMTKMMQAFGMAGNLQGLQPIPQPVTPGLIPFDKRGII
jgi:hypothetical protein